MTETMRGAAPYRWPVENLLVAGYGVMVSCYGSWMPDTAQAWRSHGVFPLLGLDAHPAAPGAISLWGWAISPLILLSAIGDRRCCFGVLECAARGCRRNQGTALPVP